ncbi:three-Cys-motif partner protein TcmP [Endothiovibrio diazotrophicus]
MDDPKYIWRIGTPPPGLDRHTEIKHQIIEEYVRRYILTLMSCATIPVFQLSLVDGFCGGGCYVRENGEIADGSPILMIRAANEARAILNLGRRTPRQVNVDYHFIDINQDTTDYLRFWIDGKRESNNIQEPDYRSTNIVTNDFTKELPTLIRRIKSKKMGEHCIFVLDQYNYDDVPMHSIARIFRELKGAEVILTFNVGTLITFLSDRAQNRKPVKRIGLDGHVPWSEIRTIKATQKQRWKQILQSHIANGIQIESGARFMTPFFVRPWGSTPWDYWLIHLSNQYRAHAVMKNLHWEHSTEFAHELSPGYYMLGYDANKDSSYTSQPSLLFDETSRDKCLDGLREHFGRKIYEEDKAIKVRSIFENTIGNSMANEPHLLDAVSQLSSSKDIIVISKDGKRKKPESKIALSDTVEKSNQLRLLLS